MEQHLGSITVNVSCQVEGDVDDPIATGPPSLAVEIDLPVNGASAHVTAAKMLRKVAQQLDPE